MSLKNHFKSVHKVVKCESFTSTSRDLLTSITVFSYFKKHYQKCKVKLTGKIGAEDYCDLMCKRMVNYEVVGASDHIIKFIK